jgi:hypothetical protein
VLRRLIQTALVVLPVCSAGRATARRPGDRGQRPTIHALSVIFAWAADVYSVDGKGFGQGRTPDSNDHTTLHVLGHAFDFTQIFAYAGSGYNSFFGIVSDAPFSAISFTAGGDGDRFRLDNVSIAR